MLIYVDNPNNLRVYRSIDSPGGPKRMFLGRILKASYEFIGDTEEELPSKEEKSDIQRVIQTFKDAQQIKLKAEALSFPEVARRVTEFYATSNDDVQRRLISTAVLQMSRAIRKVDEGA
ncbi:hypothetical protein [Reyranella sp.]|jgi:hypothetical protein|uniref:hypothetical protein n=1 Tax=Reyranella sp. TaxID=1929291 RepID=UPI003D0CC4B2